VRHARSVPPSAAHLVHPAAVVAALVLALNSPERTVNDDATASVAGPVFLDLAACLLPLVPASGRALAPTLPPQAWLAAWLGAAPADRAHLLTGTAALASWCARLPTPPHRQSVLVADDKVAWLRLHRWADSDWAAWGVTPGVLGECTPGIPSNHGNPGASWWLTCHASPDALAVRLQAGRVDDSQPPTWGVLPLSPEYLATAPHQHVLDRLRLVPRLSLLHPGRWR